MSKTYKPPQKHQPGRPYYASPQPPRRALSNEQVAMLTSLVSERINRLTSLAVISHSEAEVRRQWSMILKKLQEL